MGAPNARIVWRDPSHAVEIVSDWIDCRVQHDDHTGSIVLTLPWSNEQVQAHIAGGTWGDLFQHAVQVYYRDMTTPLLTGAVVKVDTAYGYGELTATVTCESLFCRVWRSCIAQEPTNDKYYNVTAAGQAVDILAQRFMNDGLGKTYANGGMFTTAPVESSTTILRGDASQFAPWTITVPAIHSPALSANTLTMDQSSGGNLLAALLDFAVRGDIAYTITESGTPGTWECNSTGSYQRNDVSASVILSDRRGNLLSFRRSLDMSGVRNTWLIKGNGDTTAQSKAWSQDSSAVTVGRLEDTATAEAVTLSGSLTQLSNRQMNLYAEALDSIEVTVAETSGFLFNSTAGLRDLITVRCEELGYASTHVIRGYNLAIPSNGVATVALTLNSHPRRWTSDAADWQHGPGGRGGGGMFARRDG